MNLSQCSAPEMKLSNALKCSFWDVPLEAQSELSFAAVWALTGGIKMPENFWDCANLKQSMDSQEEN